MRSPSEVVDPICEELVDIIEDKFGQYPGLEEMEYCLQYFYACMIAGVARIYQDRTRKYEAICLGIPEHSSRARVRVAFEELAEQLGSEEAAKTELEKRINERYPRKNPTEEKEEGEPDKDIFN